MKSIKIFAGLFSLFFVMNGFGQGPLTPPGAPGPVMKTLDQVEARTPVSGAGTISQSGSCYLTGNVTNGGITVSANNVTLDLNGFSIIGSSGNGIMVSGAQNVVVRNGSVQGFDIGVFVSGASVCRFEKLTVSDSDTIGFYFNGAGGACNGNVVEACTVIGNGERGLHFIGNVGECSFNQVKDCLIGNNRGDGIYFEGQSEGRCNENQVSDSVIAGNSESGIWFNGLGGNCSGNEIRNCQITGNSYGGIRMQSGCNENRVVDNTLVNNGGSIAGLTVLGSGNLISGNIVKGNATNYNFSAENQLNLLISEIPANIEWPCSVKLSGTLTCSQTGVNGITVSANDVTIDMAGHTLVGPGASSGHGIYQPDDYCNLRLFNGNLVRWAGSINAGLYVSGSSAIISGLQVSSNYFGMVASLNSTIDRCTAHDNASYGLFSSEACTINDCTAYTNGNDGIYALLGSTINRCTAYGNGDNGVYADDGSTISHCTAYGNAGNGVFAEAGSTVGNCSAYDNDGHGISVNSGSSVVSCTVRNNGGDGVVAVEGCTVRDCTAEYNTGDGIEVASGSRVKGCTSDSNGYLGSGAGIHATYFDNRIEDNNVTDNDRGIDVDFSGNLIVRNSASGNTINYDIVANNKVGVIVNAPNSVAISGSTGGSGVGSTDPWANFSF